MAVTDRLVDRTGATRTSVVRMPVELDFGGVGDLRTSIAAAMLGSTGAIELDCSRLTFIDAAGIGALVWSANAADEAGREVRLLHPGPMLHRMLSLTDVRQRFVVDAA